MSDSKPIYEGMFLFNPSEIGSSIATATELVQQVLDHPQIFVFGELLEVGPWQDCRWQETHLQESPRLESTRAFWVGYCWPALS